MSTLLLRLFDGSRELFAAPASFLVTLTDGHQKQQHRDFHSQNQIEFTDLPFFDNLGDNYTVLVFAEGYRQAGYSPVKLSGQYVFTLDIMLVKQDPGFNFAQARWPAAASALSFLASGDAPEQRYDDLLDRNERALACILNLGEAMSQIHLAQGTPIDYLKQLRWDPPYAPANDRFFAWADIALIDQVRRAAAAGQFAVDPNPGLLHPGATASWKQIQFGEANVQLTFHEGQTQTIDGTSCVLVEPDMDYYRDLAAHILLEVIPNAISQTLTNPVEVYVLRWIAGRTSGLSEFAPLYTLT